MKGKGMSLRLDYLRRVREADRQRERVDRIKQNTMARLLRQDNRRDRETQEAMASADPLVKAAIGDQQFARNEAIMYGAGAILQTLDDILYELRALRAQERP